MNELADIKSITERLISEISETEAAYYHVGSTITLTPDEVEALVRSAINEGMTGMAGDRAEKL